MSGRILSTTVLGRVLCVILRANYRPLRNPLGLKRYMGLTLDQIIKHNRESGRSFFSEKALKRRGDSIRDFRLILHGERIFLYSRRRKFGPRVHSRLFTLAEYDPDTGHVFSAAPGGIVFKNAEMVKDYISLLSREKTL